MVISLVINLISLAYLFGIQNEVLKSNELEWNKNTVEVIQASIVYRNDLGWNQFDIQITVKDYNFPETLHGKLPLIKKINYMLSANGIYVQNSENHKISNNLITQNIEGILLRNSPRCTINDNTISHNLIGVKAIDCIYSVHYLKDNNDFIDNGDDIKSKNIHTSFLTRIMERFNFLKNLFERLQSLRE